MLALPLAYQLFRMGYFACLVPNTAVAKEAALSYWSHGWIYFKEFEETYQLWVLLLTLVVAEIFVGARLWRQRERRSTLVVAAPALGGLLYGLYITRMGGDFLHARLLLPGLFALILPVSTLPLREFRVLGLVLIPWAIVCVGFSEIPHDNDDLGIERGRLNFILLSKNDHPVTVEDYKQMGWGIEADNLAKQMDDPEVGDVHGREPDLLQLGGERPDQAGRAQRLGARRGGGLPRGGGSLQLQGQAAGAHLRLLRPGGSVWGPARAADDREGRQVAHRPRDAGPRETTQVGLVPGEDGGVGGGQGADWQ